MEDSSHHHHPTPSRLRIRNTGGEIVEVQGGHIVRSTGRKDRHSKVCTAKGPRDRRVRLAAHTAIQFYDVQDRLGYDRPSKAVDWLIKKAKVAIDELAQLPAWHPNNCSANASLDQEEKQKELEEEERRQQQLGIQDSDLVNSASVSSSKRPMTMLGGEDEQQALHQRGNGDNSNAQNSSFLPPSLDSDSIADTIKSFFPVGALAEASISSAMQFHNFPTPDLLSRNSSNIQDLRLSLQSFQDPTLLHHQNQQRQQHHSPTEQSHSQSQVLLSGTPLGFDGAAGWPEHHQQVAELGRFQRLAAWNVSDGDTVGGSGGAASGYLFSLPPAPQPMLQQLLGGQNQFLSQRGPLQSSNTPSARGWMDPSAITLAAVSDHSQQHTHHHPVFMPYPSSISGIGFATGVVGFSGLRIPAIIQGDQEKHDGYSDKPSSASSDSRH